jgi:hypothetical protein
VHQDNNLDTGYFHFDLSDLGADSEITEARLQLDSQTNSWGDTTVSVYAVADPGVDWDLDVLPESEINVLTAPQSDWESFAWTGDPGPNNETQQRFNAPLPFLDEGGAPGSIVRELELFIFNENQDPNTDDAGNSYGGFAGGDGPGTAGSADGDDNVWPVKNAVDIDVTDLVRWKLGQNPGYSTFDPEDRDLTILVRTDDGDNGFVRYITKESNFLGGELDLAPARLALNGNIVIAPAGPELLPGDADQDLDFDQLDLVRVQQAAKYLTGQVATWGEGDWDGAPGGSQGNPPAGNGQFDTLDIVAALAPGHYLAGPYAARSAPVATGDRNTALLDAAAGGQLPVEVPGTEPTSMNLQYVPESSTIVLLWLGFFTALLTRWPARR